MSWSFSVAMTNGGEEVEEHVKVSALAVGQFRRREGVNKKRDSFLKPTAHTAIKSRVRSVSQCQAGSKLGVSILERTGPPRREPLEQPVLTLSHFLTPTCLSSGFGQIS